MNIVIYIYHRKRSYRLKRMMTQVKQFTKYGINIHKSIMSTYTNCFEQNKVILGF